MKPREIALGVILVMSLFGCMGKQKFAVDYGGNKDLFIGAKDAYYEGATVRLSVPLATDTDYSLAADGKSVRPEVTKNGSQLTYTFKMPDHDIKVEFSSHNSMVNTASEPESLTEGKLLLDYYSAPAAVVGEAEYHEITVNEGADGALYFNVYTGSAANGTTTSHKAYKATEEVLDKAKEVVDNYGMDTWNDEPGVGLTGAVRVCKFIDEYGDLVRVSTEHMPEDGNTAVYAFAEALSSCLEGAEEVPLE